MIKELTKLVRSKRQMRENQRRFREKLEKSYPNLIQHDTHKFLELIGKELEILLSSSVVFKTGRFKIPVPAHWRKVVILTRSPGLKSPYLSYPAFSFRSVDRVTPEGNLRISGRGYELSVLKGNPKIKQDKLKIFYQYLKELLKIKALVVKFCIDPYDTEKYIYKAQNFEIMIPPIDFRIKIKKPKEVWYSERMHEFSAADATWAGKVSLDVQESLLNEYPKIHQALKNLDKEKGLIVTKLQSLLKKLKEENQAFRVLQKLSQ